MACYPGIGQFHGFVHRTSSSGSSLVKTENHRKKFPEPGIYSDLRSDLVQRSTGVTVSSITTSLRGAALRRVPLEAHVRNSYIIVIEDRAIRRRLVTIHNNMHNEKNIPDK